MDDELLITQMGLILTQVRFVRMALEGIERSTSHYGSFNFAEALQAGERYGAPPLINGALKVYVVNINELAPGRGLGGFIEGLLGGIGRLFGGFLGGIVGGTASMVTLPIMIAQVSRIVSNIRRIFDAMAAWRPRPSSAETSTEASEEQQGSGLSAFIGALPRFIEAINSLTTLLQVAAPGSGTTSASSTEGEEEGAAETGGRWLDTLNTIYSIIRGISHVIDGLIILIPLLIGALAMFLVRLDSIKLAIVEMLQILLRNVFLLRGAVLVTIYDTVSSVARLVANILGILATAADQILESIFNMITQLLRSTLEILRTVSNSVRRTIDAILPWLVNTVGAALISLGSTRVFRIIYHLVRILPAIIPPLLRAIGGVELTPGESQRLNQAAQLTVLEPIRPGAPGAAVFPPFPNLEEEVLSTGTVDTIVGQVQRSGETISGETRRILGTLEENILRIGNSLDANRFDSNFDDLLTRVQVDSNNLANILMSAQQQARERPQTGLEAIANAYEQWLSERGLDTLIGRINEYFLNMPATGVGALQSVPGRAVIQAAAERERATVDIENVNVILEPPPVQGEESQPRGELETEDDSLVVQLFNQMRDLRERGYTGLGDEDLAFV